VPRVPRVYNVLIVINFSTLGTEIVICLKNFIYNKLLRHASLNTNSIPASALAMKLLSRRGTITPIVFVYLWRNIIIKNTNFITYSHFLAFLCNRLHINDKNCINLLLFWNLSLFLSVIREPGTC
jgi:hypothetical protein